MGVEVEALPSKLMLVVIPTRHLSCSVTPARGSLDLCSSHDQSTSVHCCDDWEGEATRNNQY